MLSALAARLKQGHRTTGFPQAEPQLPERYRGRPVIRPDTDTATLADACPTDALQTGPNGPAIDLGRCLFCGACTRDRRVAGISFSREFRMAARRREELLVTPRTAAVAEALHAEAKRLFGRSFRLRQVSAGGCNACEADTNVLNTVVFDLSRFGIQFVASPRHADGLLVTGPVPENMREALLKTYDAVPAPKVVIAVGACAISGGPYRDHPEVHNGCGGLLPVDLYVPGCPPHPLTILDGLLRFLGQC
jgi:Ni,Fe-hydrogenase III small subunit